MFCGGVVCCIVRHGCGAAVRSVSVKFVAFGVLWRFVAFCGVLWRFVAFCGFLAICIVPGKLKFFCEVIWSRHLIVSNGKTGKCHFVADVLQPPHH
jgi:hypothetical protein